MRPRVFPAENRHYPATRATDTWVRRFNEAAGIPRGKLALPGHPQPHLGDASMRPRVFPAENLTWQHVVAIHQDASMRPRVFPAENLAT